MRWVVGRHESHDGPTLTSRRLDRDGSLGQAKQNDDDMVGMWAGPPSDLDVLASTSLSARLTREPGVGHLNYQGMMYASLRQHDESE